MASAVGEAPAPSAAAAAGGAGAGAGAGAGSGAGGKAAKSTDGLEGIEKQLAELYIVHDTVFTKDPAEKAAQIKTLVDGVVAEVAKLTPSSASEKAEAAYWHGKALNAQEPYSSEAETLLSQAVKLNPKQIDAWNQLGVCFWKKGDKTAARECFSGALEQEKNKESLRHLSMLMRQLGATPQEKAANIQESVSVAKQAVALDLSDSESWYVLGNAYLAVFFATKHATSDLEAAMKAYKQADKDGSSKNPDLHFNRGNVYKYLEDYDEAAASFRAALALDPSLPAKDEVDGIEKHVQRVADLVTRKGRIKPKRLKALAKTLPAEAIRAKVAESKEADKREFVAVTDLKEGKNPGKMLLLKLVAKAIRSGHPPACLVMMDEHTNTTAVSLYHLTDKACDGFSQKDVFIALEPYVKTVTMTQPDGSSVSYRTVQILHPNNFYVNGQSVSGAFVHESLQIDNRSH